MDVKNGSQPETLAWHGGAMAAVLDPNKEQWIDRVEWLCGGVRAGQEAPRRLGQSLTSYGLVHQYASEAHLRPDEAL